MGKLVLSRNLGESLIIGDELLMIEVTVSKIERNQVKLAIEAPKNIKIIRKELLGEGFPNSTSNSS